MSHAFNTVADCKVYAITKLMSFNIDFIKSHTMITYVPVPFEYLFLLDKKTSSTFLTRLCFNQASFPVKLTSNCYRKTGVYRCILQTDDILFSVTNGMTVGMLSLN